MSSSPRLAMALALVACSSNGAVPADAGADGPADASAPSDVAPDPDAPSALEQRGEIRVIEGSDGHTELDAFVPRVYGRLVAKFYASPPPRWHTEVARDGACTLSKFVPSDCEPFCDGVCVAGTCHPFQILVSAGTVSITGLTVGVTLAPDDWGHYYLQNISTPAELFATGAAVNAHATGAATGVGAFDVATAGVAPLVTAIVQNAITLVPHADHVLAWTPAGDASARVRVTLNANNKSHGQPYEAIIECDLPDASGSVTIPSAMVDAFPATLNWYACVARDCPRSTIVRYRRGVAAVDGGWVGLIVGSEVAFGVNHQP